MSEIKAVQIFHAVDLRVTTTPREAAKIFKNGGYYQAGVVRIRGPVVNLMEAAYVQSQNDNHPNPEL